MIKVEDEFYVLEQTERIKNGRYFLQKNYQNMLCAIFSDRPQLKKEIMNLGFNDDDMISIVEKYNKIKYPNIANKIIAHKVKPITKFGLEVSSGFLRSEDTEHKNGYSIGCYLDILKPDLSENISYIFGINYSKLEYYLGKKEIFAIWG